MKTTSGLIVFDVRFLHTCVKVTNNFKDYAYDVVIDATYLDDG